MDCLVCRILERDVESRRNQYFEARSAAFYRVSTELAAYKNVEMERAKSDLEEHRMVCLSAAKVGPGPRGPAASIKSSGPHPAASALVLL